VILVTGAAGKTGRAIVAALAARGCSVRALVHVEPQVNLLRSVGAREAIVGDMLSPSSMSQAARGVDAIYHICPNVNPDEASIGKIAIEAAEEAGAKQFVFHSVLHPQVEAMPHHWLKLRVEEALFESKLAYTILQPAAYMQNVLSEWASIVEHGVFKVPYSVESPLSLVDLEDVAQAGAVALAEPGHTAATYELAGGEILTPSKIAQIFASKLNRDVRAEKIAIQDWRKRAPNLGSYQAETLVKMFDYYDQYGLLGNPRVLEGLIGRPCTKFEQFVERTMRAGASAT